MTQDPDRQDERRQLAAACHDLVREFGERLSETDVMAHFEQVVHEYDAAPIRTFVPVLAVRQARSQLRELAGA